MKWRLWKERDRWSYPCKRQRRRTGLSTDGGEDVSLKRPSPCTPHPGRFLVLISATSWVDSRARRFGSTEKSNDLMGHRPANFRHVTQWLDQMHYGVPLCKTIILFLILLLQSHRSLSIRAVYCYLFQLQMGVYPMAVVLQYDSTDK
jgi:hypothetical protein